MRNATSDVAQAPQNGAASSAVTVLGTTLSDAANPLVRAALAVLEGMPLARVGQSIEPYTTGWYVRPDVLATVHGTPHVSVRYVHRGTFRPANPGTARQLLAEAARRFREAGWTIESGPATALIIRAPRELPEVPRFARSAAERARLLADLRAAAADTPAHVAYLDQLTAHCQATGTCLGGPGGEDIEGLDGYWSVVLWAEAQAIHAPAARPAPAYSANYRRLRALANNPALTLCTLAVPGQLLDHLQDTDDRDVRAALATITRKGRAAFLTAPLWLHEDILDACWTLADTSTDNTPAERRAFRTYRDRLLNARSSTPTGS
ncbi:hypothetical protein [Streptomyces subrutilus]|uniref:hypothetical protein n=1 Tax=Streptomyces subrutilus TaxID=36818 RepID=UPI0033C83F57